MSVVEKAMDKVRRSREAAAATEGSAESALGSLVQASSRTPAGAGVAPLDLPIQTPSRSISLDLEQLRAAGYLPEAVLERRFSAQYRQIKRPIIEKAMNPENPGSKARLIMLTSALPGDGKTFTSINLAFSMAREHDFAVLLIDADVASPRISDVFGQKQSPGLLDALQDTSIDVESLVLGTNVTGLSFLPAGRPVDSATELLCSGRMSQIVARLSANPRRLVLFDSPPLLVSTEAPALLRSADQVILVVRAGKTPRHALSDAIGQIDEEKSIGLVLNDSWGTQSAGYYGYGSYGRYGDEPDAPR